jgi:hypothetical protein
LSSFIFINKNEIFATLDLRVRDSNFISFSFLPFLGAGQQQLCSHLASSLFDVLQNVIVPAIVIIITFNACTGPARSWAGSCTAPPQKQQLDARPGPVRHGRCARFHV